MLLIRYNRLEVLKADVQLPGGQKETIKLPFKSKGIGDSSIYIYTVHVTNSFLFSGTIQVVPDDCVEQILINKEEVNKGFFRSSGCDNLNGFYLDVKPYLKSGDNEIQLTIRNIEGRYGLNIRDMTFYGRYILYALIILVIVLLDFKYIYPHALKFVKKGLIENRITLLILSVQAILLLIAYEAVKYSNYPNFYKGVLFSLLSLFPLVPVSRSIVRSVKNGWLILSIFILGVLIWLAYGLMLPYSQYSYDYNGHSEYIQYIVANHEIPNASGGWSFYHPSFYYRCAATIWELLDFDKIFYIEELLKFIQAFSLMMFIIYVYFSLKTVDLIFRRLTEGKRFDNSTLSVIHFLLIGLVLFWPANAITSVRLGNDMLFYLCYAISFYFIAKWWYSGRFKHFLLSLIFAVLDVWAKTNGFIVLGVVGFLLVIRFVYKNSFYLKHEALRSKSYIFVVVTCITLYLSFNEQLDHVLLNSDSKLIVVGNANQLGDDLLVQNKLENYVFFDPVAFVKIPFTSVYEDSKGRNYFWFYLFKTSMFGEFNFSMPELRFLGSLLSSLLLFILAFSSFGMLATLNKKVMCVPVIVGILGLLISMLVFRFYYPYSSSNDFRYIYPAICPMALAAGLGGLRQKMQMPFFFTFVFLAGMFILSSISFQLILLTTLF